MHFITHSLMTLTVTIMFILALPILDADATDANEVLTRADAIRNPAQSFFMKVRVRSDGESDSVFEVSTKGQGKTLIKTKEPARDRGRNLLMLDENMFVYIPSLKRAVRVALSQKLSGQAANGDIGRMRWQGDYLAEFVTSEETAKEWVLDLKAQKKGLTYEKIKVWVQKSDFHPLRAEYLAGTGKLLKRARFGEYKMMAGAIRPSLIEIESATNQNEKSQIIIEEMDLRTFSDALFNQNNLN